MGQGQSGFVVEVARPRKGTFQAIPQCEPTDEPGPSDRPEWRIIVNPSAEFFGSDRLKELIEKLHRQQKLLSIGDAKQVVHALAALDPQADLLLPLLTLVSNATAYTANQIILREASVVSRVVGMLLSGGDRSYPRPVRLMLLQCIANMAVATENLNLVRPAIPIIVNRLTHTNHEVEAVVAMQALTNLSLQITKEQIDQFEPAIHICLQRLWTRGEVNMHALRLLLNISCCPDMVPYVLAAKPVTGLLRVLDTDKDEILVRAVTWLLCTTSAVEALGMTIETISPHIKDPFHNPSHTLYYCIFGPKPREELVNRAQQLCAHQNKEIASKSRRLLETLKGVPQFPTPIQPLNRL
ncbi:unnamed protein product, partial [Mesorhabditis belari]|uniref:Armadillo repeat-containing domain-containing protein n=1 Tax=Mesorhabditis belari TaxID=2138241 RepID=A0AAF3FBI0_9BILA